MKQCKCEKPDCALVNGVFLGKIPTDGEKIKPFIGKFICFECGGEVAPAVGSENYVSVTASTVLERLKKLNIV